MLQNGGKTSPSPDLTPVICYYCSQRFDSKADLIAHLDVCKVKNVTCEVCHVSFTNKGNLAKHNRCKKTALNKLPAVNKKINHYECNICARKFNKDFTLMKHIRDTYFGKSSETYLYKTKSINDVWVEKVLNSDISILMRKIKNNVIVMKKYDETAASDISKADDHVFVKPKGWQKQKKVKHVACKYCNKLMRSTSISRHIRRMHMKINSYKCDKCTFKSKRKHDMLRHVCSERATKLRATIEKNKLAKGAVQEDNTETPDQPHQNYKETS